MFTFIIELIKTFINSEESYYNDPYVEYLSETPGTYTSLKEVWTKTQEQ